MISLEDFRAFYLNPVNIRLRAEAFVNPTPESAQGWARATRGYRTSDIEPPVLPAAPEVTWFCVPTELRGVSIRVDKVGSLYAFWARTVVIGGIRFRTGSGRRVHGRATWHGRLNYARSFAALRAWEAECRLISTAFQEAKDAVFAEHEAALISLISTMTPTRQFWHRGEVFTAVPTSVYDWSSRSLLPGFALFSPKGRIVPGGALTEQEIRLDYTPIP